MKKIILVVLLLSSVIAVLVYAGGNTLLIGLGVLTLTAIIFGSFAFGALWTAKTIELGVRLTIEATHRNDVHDASKIRALSALTKEAIRSRDFSIDNYPALPSASGIDNTFMITGLDDEKIQQGE